METVLIRLVIADKQHRSSAVSVASGSNPAALCHINGGKLHHMLAFCDVHDGGAQRSRLLRGGSLQVCVFQRAGVYHHVQRLGFNP